MDYGNLFVVKTKGKLIDCLKVWDLQAMSNAMLMVFIYLCSRCLTNTWSRSGWAYNLSF